MKNNKFAKISLVVLALALCIGAIFAMSASATEDTSTKKPEIISQNIQYSSQFKLMYAVDADTVADGAVTLYIYNKDPKTDASAAPIDTITVEAATPAAQNGNLGKDAYIFTCEKGVSYTEMATCYYAKAVDSANNESAIKRYSVAEYFYQRLATTGDNAPSDKQETFYNNAIAFGASAQEVLAEETDTTAATLISDLRYVTVTGGTIDGYSAGVYEKNTTLYPVAADASSAKWTVTTYDSEGNSTSTDVTDSFVVDENAVKTEVVFKSAVSKPTIIYREGISTFAGLTSTSVITSRSGATVGIVTDDADHGEVVRVIPTTSNNSGATLVKSGSTTSYNDATAFELSFDFKIDEALLDADATIQHKLFIDKGAASAAQTLSIFSKRSDTGAIKFEVGVYNADKSTFTSVENVDPTEWNHIRIVIAKDYSTISFYFNGSETADAIIDGNGDISDISSINSFRLVAYNSSATLQIPYYIDNYYCGYIAD